MGLNGSEPHSNDEMKKKWEDKLEYNVVYDEV